MEKHVEDTVAGGTWIFLSSLTVSLSGFVFWLVVTRLVGAESVGIASVVVSSASIAATLTSAGMNIAVIRESAAKGPRTLSASLLLAVVVGCVAASVSIPLIGGLGYSYLATYTTLLALLSTVSIALTCSLIGLERFRRHFIAVAAGSTAKLGVGVALAAIGLGFLAPILGFLAYPPTSSIVALAALTPLIGM